MAKLQWTKTRPREYVSLCGRFGLYTFPHVLSWCLEDIWTGAVKWVPNFEAGWELAEEWNNSGDGVPLGNDLVITWETKPGDN